MQTLLSLAVVFGALVVVATVFQAWRKSRRNRGALLGDGEQVLREVEDIGVRLYVNRNVPGGPRAPGGRDRARMVLSGHRLILATGHGRVLEMGGERPGSVRCTGPRRLVVEGHHPSGRAEVRAEMAIDDAEGWQEAATALDGISVQRTS